VAGELTSLRITIEGLQEDFVNDDVDVPSSPQENVVSIVTSCSKTVNDMDKLRSNLEAHKMSSNIAIDMLDLSVPQVLITCESSLFLGPVTDSPQINHTRHQKGHQCDQGDHRADSKEHQ
jgi:hypothetical protein